MSVVTSSMSVIIPTLDRADQLRHTLTQLLTQAGVSGGFEIIVVENPGIGSAAQVVAEMRAHLRPDIELRLLQEAAPGPAAKRNLGIKAARSDLLLFLGDDTAPVDDALLAGHLQAQDRLGRRSAVLGTITWTDANESTLMEWLERGIQFNYGALRAGPVPMERYFYTSNVSIPAAIVGGLGGFDPRFETAAMEDIELGWRLRQAGTELVYQPELVVVHDHPTSYAESLQRMERIGAGAAQLMTIHPDAQAIGVSRAGRPKALLLHALSRLLFPRRELPALPPALRDLRWRIIHLDAFYGGYWRARAGR